MLQSTFDDLYNIFLALDKINPTDRTENFNNYFKELTDILKEHYDEQEQVQQAVDFFYQSGNSQGTVRNTPGQS
jgi:hypothetical protein